MKLHSLCVVLCAVSFAGFAFGAERPLHLEVTKDEYLKFKLDGLYR